MKIQDKLVAAAKRAARTRSRAANRSYQLCLEEVARETGRATWKAFLLDPVPVDQNAIKAAAEPDFSLIPQEDHALAVVRYGKSIEAISFYARPRDLDDASPVLSYRLADGRDWPIDARGLSLGHVAKACLPDASLRKPTWDNVTYAMAEDMPAIDGTLMRAIVRTTWNIEPRPISISATLDGSNPIDYEMIAKASANAQKHKEPILTSIKPRKASLGRRARRLAGLLLRGESGVAADAMLKRGPLTLKEGPIVGISPSGQFLRLRPGYNLCAFSPPGTGRMAGITIPALVSDDDSSYIVHDDGQLLEHTSGWRAKIGKVAVIRIDGTTLDSINPFGREWLPEAKLIKRHADYLAQAIVPDDLRIARLIAEKATTLIFRNGETTLRDIRDEIRSRLDHPLAGPALAALATLVDDQGHAAISSSTVTPEMLRSEKEPVTIYIVRDPRVSSGTRDRLTAVIQTAIWLTSLTFEQAYVKGQPRRAVTTVIHDFHRMPAIPFMPMALSMARDYRMGTIVTGSTASSIAERYGEDKWMLPGMAHLVLVPAQSDREELAIVDMNNQIPWEQACSLDEGECIALTSGGMAPARIKMPLFFEHSRLHERVWDHRLKTGPRPIEPRR